ncbi:MAG: prepilin peptidase [Candidatus Eremiobacteraeota bacterium]|nr:prepilin peptidase [Candidatus Eremiobacteraeota bacterium]
MMSPMLITVAFALFASAAIGGVILGTVIPRDSERFDDGPPPRPVHWMWPLLAMLLLCAALASRHVTALQAAAVAAACVPLVAAWYGDARTGLISDWFTLVPLAVVSGYVVYSGHWFTVVSALVIFVPFALSALLSRGVGMGWGDVKLATLCGALVGMMAALPAFAAACLVATIVSYARDRGKRPVAFGPYIVLATFGALAVVL